jgi:hypothetical protein
MVVLENVFMFLLPLFIGFSIDDLLNKTFTALYWLSSLFVLLIVVSVIRRLYDTRVYGKIRVHLGVQVDALLVQNNKADNNISIRNARLNMSRELVDFLENDVPLLMTAVIQLIMSVIILTAFHRDLAISAVITSVVILFIYAQFHGYFIRLNGYLNRCAEQQVFVLSRIPFLGVRRHLERIMRREILISDAEAAVYGLIFLVLFGFVITNLWLSSLIDSPTAGTIFSVVTYSLEFVEAAIMLPVTLQSLSRLTEISHRLNDLTASPQSPSESNQ